MVSLDSLGRELMLWAGFTEFLLSAAVVTALYVAYRYGEYLNMLFMNGKKKIGRRCACRGM